MDGSRPNTLSVPGERAARERLETLFELVDTLSPMDLNAAPVPHPDPDVRAVMLAEAEALAARHGRSAMLEEARTALQDSLLRRFVDLWPAYPYGSAFHTSSRTEDQAAVIAAATDAAAVAVVEDVLDPRTAAALREPWLRVVGDRDSDADADAAALPGPEPGPAATAPTAPEGAPTDDDWAAAEQGPTSIDAGNPAVSSRQRAFFAIAGVAGAALAFLGGMAGEQLLLGALGAVAVAAIAWTLAGYRFGRR